MAAAPGAVVGEARDRRRVLVGCWGWCVPATEEDESTVVTAFVTEARHDSGEAALRLAL